MITNYSFRKQKSGYSLDVKKDGMWDFYMKGSKKDLKETIKNEFPQAIEI